MDRQELDCICATCERKITFAEVLTDFHSGHRFRPADMTAFMAVKDYLRTYGAAA